MVVLIINLIIIIIIVLSLINPTFNKFIKDTYLYKTFLNKFIFNNPLNKTIALYFSKSIIIWILNIFFFKRLRNVIIEILSIKIADLKELIRILNYELGFSELNTSKILCSEVLQLLLKKLDNIQLNINLNKSIVKMIIIQYLIISLITSKLLIFSFLRMNVPYYYLVNDASEIENFCFFIELVFIRQFGVTSRVEKIVFSYLLGNMNNSEFCYKEVEKCFQD